MYEPTKGMQEEAQRAIDWKEEGRKGGTRIGLGRARQILRGDPMSLDIVKRMYSYFARHEVDKKGQGFEVGEDGYPSAGRVAWSLWGGDAGYTWSTNIINDLKKQGYNMSIIKREFNLVKKYYDDDHENHDLDIYTFVVSTPEVDRYGTIIIPSGIDYTAYLHNPIVLAQHNADEWPIGRCLGFAMNGENLEATLQLHRITDDACEVADLVAAGYVKAVSVGIIPKESEEQTIDGKTVIVYTKSELVEFSVVSIPANRQSLIKKSVKDLFKSLKKVTRMLTPEQTQAITDNFLPILQDAALTYLRDELGVAEEDATKAAEAGTLAAAEAMLTILNSDAPELEPTTVEPPAAAEELAPVATASFEVPEIRIGKKIAASTQAQIGQGLSMIQDGYKIINKAIVAEGSRSINIKPLTKLSTDEIMNLI